MICHTQEKFFDGHNLCFDIGLQMPITNEHAYLCKAHEKVQHGSYSDLIEQLKSYLLNQQLKLSYFEHLISDLDLHLVLVSSDRIR